MKKQILIVLLLITLSNCVNFINRISIGGNRFIINNSYATPRGFTHVGLLNPRTAVCNSTITTCCALQEEFNAWGNFSLSEFTNARDFWKANDARIQISTILLDQTSPDYSSSYLASVVAGVQLIRTTGMMVQLTMQYQSDTRISCTGQSGSANTTRTNNAWTTIAPLLMSDSGIYFNILNEPPFGGMCGTASAWSQWQNAMQPILTNLRTTLGVSNVIIAETMGQGRVVDQTYNGANGHSILEFPLIDPNNQIAYGSHPKPSMYPSTNNSCQFYTFISNADLERNIGKVARAASFPILLTEWNSAGGDPIQTGDNSNKCWDTYKGIWNNTAGIPYNYTFVLPTPYSPSLVQTMISWLISSGPNHSPIPFTGVYGFDNGAYENNQDMTWIHPTYFDTQFQCGKLFTGNITTQFQGHGNMIKNYFSLLDLLEPY